MRKGRVVFEVYEAFDGVVSSMHSGLIVFNFIIIIIIILEKRSFWNK